MEQPLSPGQHYYYSWLGLSRSLRINPELINQGDAL